MSDPSKHHYIPAFYLRQWTRPNGFLCEMRKVREKVVVRSKAPDGTGFKKDLYKVEGVSPELAQHFERTFMHMVDTQAADAMRKLTSGDMDWSVEERDAWIRFLLSLIFRNPEAVIELRDQVKSLYQESLSTLRNSYEKLRRPEFPLTFEEFEAQSDPNAGEIAASNFLQTMMNSEGIANSMIRMRWGRLHLPKSRHKLLTSDRPLCMPMQLQTASLFIVLPIGPHVAFTAAADESELRRLARGDHTVLARQINERVVSQARQYVYGADDSAFEFVRKRIRTLPDRQLMSDKGKELARRQARGEI